VNNSEGKLHSPTTDFSKKANDCPHKQDLLASPNLLGSNNKGESIYSIKKDCDE